jgi:trehalose 6-phosphate phosphatase
MTAVRLGRFREFAGLRSMVILGQYGVERWDAATDSFDLPPEPEAVAAAAAELPQLLAELDLEQARVEHKGRAVGVHTRELPDPRGAYERLEEPLSKLAERHGLVVEPGRHVLELRAPGLDKGIALERLVRERQPEVIVFAGDDLGDLPAFAVVDQLRGEGLTGLLICSASHEEEALAGRADLVVDGPTGVASWLSDLANALEVRRHDGRGTAGS